MFSPLSYTVRHCVGALFLFTLLFSSSAVFAEESAAADAGLMSLAAPQDPSASASAPAPNKQAKVGGKNNDNNGKVAATSYAQIGYSSMERLVWSLGVRKLESNADIDAYLMLSECPLYAKYYQNEFEWEKLRKAARKYLQEYGNDVPRYYEYTQTIRLGRYDLNLQGFPIVDVDSYTALKSMQLVNYKSGLTECGQFPFDSEKYPGAATVNLVSPLSLTFIRVPKDLAMAYIDWRGEEGFEDADVRSAFIRFRLRVDGYSGISSSSGTPSYVFFGRLMELDVFADKEMLMPLYNQIF